ncbi:2Fe-2S iron-sulfur cluster-binding protein [Zhongshania marina]|uniref:2Fe-2S ferredoxin-type domain-containing protein n=1 Tax=Zhongshania marina TaxID=2304603 RepID=A0A2S4HKH3_9GAMM|nr:hypothetical protein C0068_01480 [Marortus luteolus]
MYKIKVLGSDLLQTTTSNEPILNALIKGRKEYPISSGCKKGGCGICKVRVIDGSFDTGNMSASHVNNDLVENGIVLACQTFACSDLTVEILPINKRRMG